MEVKTLMASTTRGLVDLGALRKRLTRDYGLGALSWDDFFFMSSRLNEIEERLIDLAGKDPKQLESDERATA